MQVDTDYAAMLNGQTYGIEQLKDLSIEDITDLIQTANSELIPAPVKDGTAPRSGGRVTAMPLPPLPGTPEYQAEEQRKHHNDPRFTFIDACVEQVATLLIGAGVSLDTMQHLVYQLDRIGPAVYADNKLIPAAQISGQGWGDDKKLEVAKATSKLITRLEWTADQEFAQMVEEKGIRRYFIALTSSLYQKEAIGALMRGLVHLFN